MKSGKLIKKDSLGTLIKNDLTISPFSKNLSKKFIGFVTESFPGNILVAEAYTLNGHKKIRVVDYFLKENELHRKTQKVIDEERNLAVYWEYYNKLNNPGYKAK
ncbi:hypothetical protein J4411_00115 [Candidatus Pacearchaeota archaeon]|nr:hypothetical protein [uncultured archaeon]MBS3084304.1 hypothetical protein [Candidatus Pacearchaeota archaeon]